MNLKRLLLAFVLSPLATPLFFAIVWIAWGTLDFERNWMLLVLIGVFAYATALLGGVPLVLATRHLKKPAITLFIVVGALAGLLPGLILGVILGSFGGFLFYLMCGLA